MKPTRDWTTKEGAAALAAKIEAYWSELGYRSAKAWIEPRKNAAGTILAYDVRSNLVGGLPPEGALPMAAE